MYPTLSQADLKGKRVLLRAGFDVPLQDGKVTDTTRVEALLPTMRHILDAGAALIIVAHQGRPKGKADPAFSQRPLVPVLEKLLQARVAFAESCTGEAALRQAKALKPGEILLLENLRFDPRENSKEPAEREALAKKLAALADV